MIKRSTWWQIWNFPKSCIEARIQKLLDDRTYYLSKMSWMPADTYGYQWAKLGDAIADLEINILLEILGRNKEETED